MDIDTKVINIHVFGTVVYPWLRSIIHNSFLYIGAVREGTVGYTFDHRYSQSSELDLQRSISSRTLK